MAKITVIGTTSWGITLAIMLAKSDTRVRLWARTEKEAKRIRTSGFNSERFPEAVMPPPQLEVTSRMEDAVEELKAEGFSDGAVEVVSKTVENGYARDILEKSKRGFDALAVGRFGFESLGAGVLGGVAAKQQFFQQIRLRKL